MPRRTGYSAFAEYDGGICGNVGAHSYSFAASFFIAGLIDDAASS
jgi:hypothetical protein